MTIYLAIFCLIAALFFKQKILLNLLSLLFLAFYFDIFAYLSSGIQVDGRYFYLYLLAILGLILLMLELYIPSFGLVGLFGLFFYGLSLYFKLGNFGSFVLLIISNLGFAFIIFLVFLKLGYSISLPQVLVLQQSHQKDQGYQSRDSQTAFLGKSGKAVTDLRPVGLGSFDQEQIEVISKVGFIEKGQKIIVIKVSNGSVYVKEDIENG